MDVFTINHSFELRGYWALPGSQDQIAGIMKYSNEGINLELFGSFLESPFKMDIGHYDFIIGNCEGGHKVTLADGFEENYNLSGIITSKLTFNKMYIGNHFAQYDECVFDSVELSISNLEEWAGRRVFSFGIDENEAGSKSFSLTHSSPEDVIINIHSINSTLHFSHNFKVENGISTGNMRHEERIILRPDSEKSVDWYVEHLYDLRGLFTLLANRPLNLRQVTFLRKNEGDSKRQEMIHYFPGKSTLFPEKSVGSFELFLSLPRILPAVELIFNRWFDLNISSAKRLYLNNLFGDGTDSVYGFINLAKAIESYHRDINGNQAQYLTNSRHNKIRRKMTKAVEEELDPFILSKYRDALAHAHHFEFGRRVIDLFEDIDERIKELLFTDCKTEHLAERVKRTRNWHTHYGKKQEGVIEGGFKLFYVNSILKTVMFYHLCKYLGINDDILLKALSEDYNLTSILGTAKSIVMEDFGDPSIDLSDEE